MPAGGIARCGMSLRRRVFLTFMSALTELDEWTVSVDDPCRVPGGDSG